MNPCLASIISNLVLDFDAYRGATYDVDDNSSEDGRGNFWSVLGVITTADELWVILVEENAENTEDDEGEERNHNAAVSCC